MPCQQRARDVEGADGSSVLVSCPPGCTDAAFLWGTDVYTDDSAVCPALVHAGVIPPGGGHALVTFARGQRTYVGSEKNGLKSHSYAEWRRSFYAQSVDGSGKPTSPAPEVADEHTARLDCTHRGSVLDGEPGVTVRIICPAGCAGKGVVWGTDTYTADSALCSAAVHAGAVTAEGGSATLTFTDGQPAYAGSARHGVTTLSYADYRMSFTLKPAP
jgi:hypothetical protein